MYSQLRRAVSWLGLGLLVLVMQGCSQDKQVYHLTGSTMGTYYSIKVILPQDSQLKPDFLLNEIDLRLERVNDQMSTYRKDSELSRFNQSRTDTPMTVSQDTAFVITEALRLNKLTSGALDVTMGPLVNLWGFGPEARPETVPSKALIAERRKMTGTQFLHVVSPTQLVKTNPDLYVDLSSIAKGFGVDVIAEYFDDLGIKDYLVEIGGEVRTRGVNDAGVPWRIAIEKPVPGQPAVQQIVSISDHAIATSGDYRNYFEENGRRYSHTIDPATAMPINHRLVSVSVINQSCMTADGLATGLMVMGPEKGLALAEKEGLAVYMIIKTDDGFESRYSSAFKPYLAVEGE
ncbi:FAD:protein FMN transferase [Vibrio stylophorae]|uniref:FAD:protein FMN transferase n=1 Tax=Vibrio stylophorae TaxID=659351 RepID=A0ABN8DP44_9VIBR|nr:FAD:protein FMN transferase [Vibrio stylophorae]CAH0532959.1 FAD:protein FMN transferase [Vibrio stylophorae]